eukprot:TRINITY_DN1982_c0_g1_i1.p1 TRINITY_DN1982_c0_g1~~TRINITY_DN1982_c0_g1_i1.p1  ORF type:complete len:868 (-),score=315.35 TRINITY_DN1982_c0_g1_i1:74-2677(-)
MPANGQPNGTAHLQPASKPNFDIVDVWAKKEVIVRKQIEVQKETQSEKKRTVFVAKQSENSSVTKKARAAEVVPLSLLTSKSSAPKRDEEGYVVPRSLLGGAEEYLEEKERLFGKDDEDLRYEEVRLHNQQLELDAYLRTVEHAKQLDDEHMNETISAMQFYDRVGEQKQERALKRREYFEAEWELQRDHLAKVSGKKPDELVFNAPDLIREKIEESEVMLKAQLLEARFFEGQIFKPPESVGPHMAPIYVKYIVPHNEPVEYIRKPGGAKPSASVRYNPKLRGPNTTFNAYKAHQQAHLSAQMKPYHPFEPEFDGLMVTGRRIEVQVNSPLMSRSTTPFGGTHKFPPRVKEAWGVEEDLDEQEIEERQRTARSGVESMAGPQVAFTDTELLFDTTPDQTQRHVVTARNTGSTAIYYTWVRVVEDNPLEIVHADDSEERFFFSDTDGVLLPGETRPFAFSFRSSAAGSFFQRWQWTSRPALPSAACVSLRAMCLAGDDTRPLRDELEARLSKQEVERGCRDLVHSIVRRMPPPRRPRPASDAYELERAAFFERNQQLGLYYHADIVRALRSVFTRAEALARADTDSWPAEWDLSVVSLQELLLRLEDGDGQSQLLRELNELVSRASFPPVQREAPWVHRIGYDLLLELADGIGELAVRERDTLGLPPRARAALAGSESLVVDHLAVASSAVAGDAGSGNGGKRRGSVSVPKKEASSTNAAAAAAPANAAAAAAAEKDKAEKARRARRGQAAAAPPPEVKAEPPPQQLEENLKLEETYRQNLQTKVASLFSSIIARFEYLADGVPKETMRSREEELRIQQEQERAQREEEERLERERKQKEEEEAAARAASPPKGRKARAAARSATRK